MPLFRYMLEEFQYYAKPEGQDPVNKLMGLAKYGIINGTFISVIDACLYSKCQNTPQFLNTFGYWVVPMTGICLAFSAITYISTSIRGKDDKWNYVFGALASGGVLHAWRPVPVISATGTALMVLYAIIKKDFQDHNYDDKTPFLPSKVPDKVYFPWRNLPYRNYNTPTFEHVKDYYRPTY